MLIELRVLRYQRGRLYLCDMSHSMNQVYTHISDISQLIPPNFYSDLKFKILLHIVPQRYFVTASRAKALNNKQVNTTHKSRSGASSPHHLRLSHNDAIKHHNSITGLGISVMCSSGHKPYINTEFCYRSLTALMVFMDIYLSTYRRLLTSTLTDLRFYQKYNVNYANRTRLTLY